MKAVQNYIDSKQQEFMLHPFFGALERLGSLEEVSCFVPELTFWVMAFQDILRLNEEQVSDPYLKQIAHHHRLEDAGHEQWFLHDRNYMCGAQSHGEVIGWLFGKENEWTRDAAYSILAEIYKSENEWLNIVLLLVIESSGHVFFEKIVEKMKEIGEDGNLKYFASSHLNVELAHALFDEEMERRFHAEPLPAQTRRSAMALVDRCYGAFHKMFDGLLILCKRQLELAR